jgi:hypothetical protein
MSFAVCDVESSLGSLLVSMKTSSREDGGCYERFHSVHLEAQMAAPLNVIEALEILADFGRTAEGRHGDVGECDTFAAHFVKSLGQSLGRREMVDHLTWLSIQ